MENQNQIGQVMGTKSAMSMRFDSRGRRIPVTSVLVESNQIFVAKNGKAQLVYGKKRKSKKTENAYVKAFGFAPRAIKEFKNQTVEVKTGDKVTVSLFEAGDAVKVTGTSKGKGFAGGIKRWGFHGGPKTHGQSDRHRAPGSIGQGTTPGRVYKGKKMAGHLGNVTKTVRGLEVIEVDSAQNILIIKGSVPGAKNGLLVIEKIGKVKTYVAPPPPQNDEEKEDTEQKENQPAEEAPKEEKGDENASK